MTTFSSRPIGYKLGVVGLFLVTVVFIVGFAAPYWYENHHIWRNLENYYPWSDYRDVGPNFTSGHQGLWKICLSNSILRSNYYDDGCNSIAGRHYPKIHAWYHVVRAFETCCLVLMVLSCGLAVVQNCRRGVLQSRALPIMAAAGGLFGFIGGMVLVGKKDRLPVHSDTAYFSWAFFMAIASSVGAILDAVVIAVSDTPSADTTKDETTDNATSGETTAKPSARRGWWPFCSCFCSCKSLPGEMVSGGALSQPEAASQLLLPPGYGQLPQQVGLGLPAGYGQLPQQVGLGLPPGYGQLPQQVGLFNGLPQFAPPPADAEPDKKPLEVA